MQRRIDFCCKSTAVFIRYLKQHVAKAIDNGALKNERNQDFIRPQDKTTRAEASSMLQGMRIAGGYDKSTKTASQDLGGKTFIERETKVTTIVDGMISRIDTLQAGMKDILSAINETENSKVLEFSGKSIVFSLP